MEAIGYKSANMPTLKQRILASFSRSLRLTKRLKMQILRLTCFWRKLFGFYNEGHDLDVFAAPAHPEIRAQLGFKT